MSPLNIHESAVSALEIAAAVSFSLQLMPKRRLILRFKTSAGGADGVIDLIIKHNTDDFSLQTVRFQLPPWSSAAIM